MKMLKRLLVIIPRKSLYNGVDAVEEANSTKLVDKVTGVDVDGGEGRRGGGGRGGGGGGGD